MMSQSIIKARVVGLIRISESERMLRGCIQVEAIAAPKSFLVTLTLAGETVLPPLNGPFQFFGPDASVEIVEDGFRKLEGEYYEGVVTQVFERGKPLVRKIA